MWRLLLLFFIVPNYFLVNVAGTELQADGNGKDLIVHFKNNGNHGATCEAEVGRRVKSFSIGAFGEDDEVFSLVPEHSQVSLSCQEVH